MQPPARVPTAYVRRMPEVEFQRPLSMEYFQSLGEQLEEWEKKEVLERLGLNHLKRGTSQANMRDTMVAWYIKQPKARDKVKLQ